MLSALVRFFLIITVLVSCSTSVLNQKRTPAGEAHELEFLWEPAIDTILRYRPQSKEFYREMLQDLTEESKRKIYEFMGKIETGHFLNEEKSVDRITPQYLKGDWEKYYLPSKEQVPYDSWDRSLRWGVSYSEENLQPWFLEKIKKKFGGYTSDVLAALFRNDLIVSFEDRYFLLPELDEVPKYILQSFRPQFYPIPDLSFEEWVETYFNVIPKREYIYSHEYFSQKKLNFSSLPKDYCSLDIRALPPTKIVGKNVRRFLQTLENEKEDLMVALKIDNSTYNEFAALAIGIFFVETSFGKSLRYFLKEKVYYIGPDFKIYNVGQTAIRIGKKLKGRDDENSRGLTQIKEFYGWLDGTKYEYIDNSNLNEPENAAIGTMFILNGKYKELKSYMRRGKHPNITEKNWSDYLYYTYAGSYGQIIHGLATPNINKKIKRILLIRNKISLFEQCD